MSIKEIMEKERWATEEVFLKKNYNAMDEAEVFDQNAIFHVPPFPDIKGLESFKQVLMTAHQNFSNIRFNWDEVVIEGNTAVQRFTLRAKHTGTSEMIPAPHTGKEVVLKGCAFYHIKNGKIVEFIEHSDYLGLFQQVGIIPPIGLNGE